MGNCSYLRSLLLFGALAGAVVAAFWLVDPRVGRLWLNTAWLAAGAGLVAVPLGTLVATGITKSDIPGRRAAGWLLVAMLFVPLYLVAGAWDAGFGMQGWHTLATNPRLAREPWLAGWRAAIWVHGLAAVPWVVLIVGAGLRAVEAEIEEDAALCGPPWRVLWHVSLPRAAPAIVVATLWTAIVAAAEISVTDLFQVRTFAEEVYTQSALGAFDFGGGRGAGSWEPEGFFAPSSSVPALTAAGLWFGVLLSAGLALAVLIAARGLLADLADVPHRRAWTWRLRRGRWPAAVALWSALLLVAGMPLANLAYKAGVEVTMTAVVRGSPDPALDAVRDQETGAQMDIRRIRSWSAAKAIERVAAAPREYRGELWQSAQIGMTAATAALLIGLPLAWCMRGKRGLVHFSQTDRLPNPFTEKWTSPLFLAALAICLAVPGPLLGIGLIRMLNQPPESALAWLAPLYDTRLGPWLVQTIRALPLVTLILWPALASIPQVMLDAAAMDRAGWWRRLVWIALPQRWAAVLAAWLVGLAIAVGELAATVLVMPPAQHTVVSVRVFQLLHYGVDDRVAALCLVMVLGIALLTAIAAALVRRTS